MNYTRTELLALLEHSCREVEAILTMIEDQLGDEICIATWHVPYHRIHEMIDTARKFKADSR